MCVCASIYMQVKSSCCYPFFASVSLCVCVCVFVHHKLFTLVSFSSWIYIAKNFFFHCSCWGYCGNFHIQKTRKIRRRRRSRSKSSWKELGDGRFYAWFIYAISEYMRNIFCVFLPMIYTHFVCTKAHFLLGENEGN